MKSDDFGCRPAPVLLCLEHEKTALEARNAVNLGAKVLELAPTWAERGLFTSELVCEFNEIAMRGIYTAPGLFRDRYSAPEGLSVPNHREVPSLVSEMCHYANAHRDDPFHVGAYLLWRTNWIHPFYDGNGRVSRELCHLAVLSGTGDTWSRPLPALIADEVDRYIEGLRSADRKWDGSNPDVAELQSFITGLYSEQTTL